MNRALASHFALALWYGYVQEQKSTEVLARALEADTSRRIVQLSFTGCLHFGDAELQVLMHHLPDVRVLRLDLCFTGLETLDSFVLRTPNTPNTARARAVPGLRCLAEPFFSEMSALYTFWDIILPYRTESVLFFSFFFWGGGGGLVLEGTQQL